MRFSLHCKVLTIELAEAVRSSLRPGIHRTHECKAGSPAASKRPPHVRPACVHPVQLTGQGREQVDACECLTAHNHHLYQSCSATARLLSKRWVRWLRGSCGRPSRDENRPGRARGLGYHGRWPRRRQAGRPRQAQQRAPGYRGRRCSRSSCRASCAVSRGKRVARTWAAPRRSLM